MNNRRAALGVGLLAFLIVIDVVSLFVTYTPPPLTITIIALGLVSVVSLGVWTSGHSPRRSMWAAVIPATIIALLGIPPLFIPDMTVGERAYFIIYLALTLIAVTLVRAELGRQPTGAA